MASKRRDKSPVSMLQSKLYITNRFVRSRLLCRVKTRVLTKDKKYTVNFCGLLPFIFCVSLTLGFLSITLGTAIGLMFVSYSSLSGNNF